MINLDKLKSRKLLMALGATVLIAINDQYALGMTQDTINAIVGITITYVIGQGFVDGIKRKDTD